MSTFITRVELHGEADYNALHNEMENEGFSRTIKGKDKVVYDLPTASYLKKGSFTIKQIFESAKRAASIVSDDFSILTTQAAKLEDDSNGIRFKLKESES